MIVNVQMIDGRVFQFASLLDVTKVVDTQPGDDGVKVQAWLRRKPEDEFTPLKVSHLRKASVVSIVDAEDEATHQDDVPAAEERDRRRSEWLAREANGHTPAPTPPRDPVAGSRP